MFSSLRVYSQPTKPLHLVDITSQNLWHRPIPGSVTKLRLTATCRSSSHMRRRSRTEVERIYYQMINERVVNDVTLEFFYKPHTVTALVGICAFLLAPSFTRLLFLFIASFFSHVPHYRQILLVAPFSLLCQILLNALFSPLLLYSSTCSFFAIC